MAQLPIALLTTAEARAADRSAGVPTATLMENAGKAVADAAVTRYGPCRAVVLAGNGNNGGDGFVAARHLKAKGFDVVVAGIGAQNALAGDALQACRAWQASGGAIQPYSDALLKKAGLVVDALFGVGLSRAPEGPAKAAIAAVNESGVPVVAVDIPSGVMADSGEIPGIAVRASLTLTFFRAKPGLFLLPGKEHAGDVQVADIGIPAAVLSSIRPACFLNAPEVWRDALPALSLATHKYTRGHAVIAGGPLSSTGAAKLAALGALRAGAGLVSIACDKESLPAYAAALSSVMTKPAHTAHDYEKLVRDKRVTALLLGPGNGTGDGTRSRILAALGTEKPCVLDADALTVLGENRKSLLPALHSACVLTPHEGEFARVFQMEGDKLARARNAADDNGAVLVLKGSDTVIAAPGGRAVVNANAPAWLATAGSGDVLSGIITGLLAQGMPPFEAAAAGVWIHGEAGNISGYGMISEDLPGTLQRVWAQLGAG